MKATCCLPPLFLYTKQKAIIGTEISKFTRNSAHPKCSSSVHRIHCYYTIKRLVEPLRALSSKGCPPHAPQWRKQKLPLRASHSPCQTERNHFSCDLLLRLEAQDTKTLPFFLVCIADIGDRDSKKKNNSARETHSLENTLWSVLFSNFTESRICTLFFSSSYFLNQGISKISLFYLIHQ